MVKKTIKAPFGVNIDPESLCVCVLAAHRQYRATAPLHDRYLQTRPYGRRRHFCASHKHTPYHGDIAERNAGASRVIIVAREEGGPDFAAVFAKGRHGSR